ncbi:MAG: hypothetical protein QOH14_1413 [Pseudonocardiales bacterium]|nr:hypothetical protein [Pseudonocardiales bacterium]
MDAVGWWFARVPASGAAPARLIAVVSGAHPDGSYVDVPADQAPTATVGWCAAADLVDGAVTALHVASSLVPAAPPLWYAELRESAARPPAVHLVALSGHGQPAGGLLDETALSNVAVTSADQLGAVRWYPATGEVDQVYVDPAHRRLRIGTGLLHAAGMLCVARGWSRLWGDGQRTAMGEAFRNASYWRERGADLTHVAPPMTPGEVG